MSEKTTNYQLTKLDTPDFGTISDLNGNADIIDAALKLNNDEQHLHSGDKNNPHNVTKVQVGLGNVDNTSDMDKPISTAQKKSLDGKADIDQNGKVLETQLPSYVDDVLEFPAKTEFPTQGESGKIYVAVNTNLTYRWTGTVYVEISPSLALGETASTAYRGDLGTQNAANIANLSSGKADRDHKHSASDLTSGTLPVLRGGTGQTSIAELRNALGITNYITEEYDTSDGWHVIKYANGRVSCELGVVFTTPTWQGASPLYYCSIQTSYTVPDLVTKVENVSLDVAFASGAGVFPTSCGMMANRRILIGLGRVYGGNDAKTVIGNFIIKGYWK